MEKLENRKLKEEEVVQLLKAKHLQTAQKGTGDSSVDVSNYCEWNFKAAKSIVAKLQSDQVITEIVLRHEAMKGSESCFNSLEVGEVCPAAQLCGISPLCFPAAGRLALPRAVEARPSVQE